MTYIELENLHNKAINALVKANKNHKNYAVMQLSAVISETAHLMQFFESSDKDSMFIKLRMLLGQPEVNLD